MERVGTGGRGRPRRRGGGRRVRERERSGILVALAYDHTTAWFLSRDILSGYVLMVDEQDTTVAVTGVLGDGTREASISIRDGARTVRTVNGVYGERFARAAGALPRVLTFTDARGRHTVRIPLSREVTG